MVSKLAEFLIWYIVHRRISSTHF